jgi:aldose sugar dehydrogenase
MSDLFPRLSLKTQIKTFGSSFLASIFLLLWSCQQGSVKLASGTILGYLQLDNSLLEISEVATGLEVPWDLDASEEGKLWFTEVSGTLYCLDLRTLEKKEIFKLDDVLAKKSYGLLGMAVHSEKGYVLLHYTFGIPKNANEEAVMSRLVRYDISESGLENRLILLDSLPGNTFHNGSRILIDGDLLYFSLGDVGKVDEAQSRDFLGGKIIRIGLDGSIPADNPFPGNPVWAVGFRNSQGLTLGKNGNLYASDHGPINDDEINLITKGGNYGWPDVAGFCDTHEESQYCSDHTVIEPLQAWTPTIATAGLSFYEGKAIPEWENSLLLATMKGRSLRVLHLNDEGDEIDSEDIYLQQVFGRIRDISIGQAGEIYLSTSNRDWHPRFQPWMYEGLPEGPDRIIRLRKIPHQEQDKSLPVFSLEKEPLRLLDENWNPEVPAELTKGRDLYATHCLACHGPNGMGSEDLIPPLANTPWVTGDKGKLIRTMLKGISGEIEVNGKKFNQEMPAFAHLQDDELAEILTFIRNQFGNKASAIISGEIFEERKGLNRQ